MTHPIKRVIVKDMLIDLGHEYPVDADALQATLATDFGTPSAGNLWAQPGVMAK